MMTRRFKTNLRCAGCVEAIRPLLDAEPSIAAWSVDLGPDKVLTLEGGLLDRRTVEGLLNKAGYQLLEEVKAGPVVVAPPPEPPKSLFPLFLIVAYLLGATLLVECSLGSFHWMRAMRHFMAGFFLVFSFFKFLDLTAFADAYQMYDLIAKRSRAYAFAYPFIELGLGVAYLLDWMPGVVNVVTLVVMLVGTAGVLNTLRKKQKIRCACLGAVFNLPMTFVTLLEDGLMAAMAAVMLL